MCYDDFEQAYSSGIIITYMRLDLDGSFAVHTTCSVLASLLQCQGECVSGSIHQGLERISNISRERQCSFMRFSALLRAQSLPIEQRTASNVDQILEKGN